MIGYFGQNNQSGFGNLLLMMTTDSQIMVMSASLSMSDTPSGLTTHSSVTIYSNDITIYGMINDIMKDSQQ